MDWFIEMRDPIAALLGSWAEELNTASVLLRMGLSLVLASLIGRERTKKRHTAGMRTFMIVSCGATMAMLLDQFLISALGLTIPLLSAATLIGVGILSTYAILYSSKNQIKGLTTAAVLWADAVLGLAAGAGLYTVTLIGFLALLICLSGLPTLEDYLKERSTHFEIHLELNDKRHLPNFVTTARTLGLKIDDIEVNPAYLNTGLSVYTIAMTVAAPELKAYPRHSQILDALRTIDYVAYIEEI